MNLTAQKHLPVTMMETRGITRFLAILAAVGLLLPMAARAGSATWELMPTSGDWNTAINWTPPTVPNGPADTATFSLSSITSVSISADTEVEGIVFDSMASPYTIIASPGFTLTLSGTGITNNSGITQNFVTEVDGVGNAGSILFFGSATAGTMTVVTNNAAIVPGGFGGFTGFFDTSTAGSSIINNNGSAFLFGGGTTDFFGSATADSATINNEGGSGVAGGGLTQFFDTSTAGNATINNNGGTAANAGGVTVFADSASAGSAIITANGSDVAGGGGFTNFVDMSTAANATLIANGGTGAGGTILFLDDTTGGTARVEVFGNGNLDISFHNLPGLTIGSLEGDGNVFLGGNNLTVGSNNADTTFSGVIQDGGLSGGAGGSLSKIGTGTLTLSGTNTYTGDTGVVGGTLLVNGSISSTTTFVHPDGTLGGTGFIAGSVGNRGTVAPGDGGPGTLTIGGTFFNDSVGTFSAEIGGLSEGVNADLLHSAGPANINGGIVEVINFGGFTPSPGDRVTIIRSDTSRNGMFDTLVAIGWPGLIQPFDDYSDPFTVDIVFELSDTFVSQALTRNQLCVAENLDAAATLSDPAAVDLVTIVGNLPIADLPTAFDLIGPEELASIYEISFSHAILQGANFQRRLSDLRDGVMGSYDLRATATQTVTENHAGGKGPQGKTVVTETKGAPMVETCPTPRWGVFATGYGQAVDVGDDGDDDDDFDTDGYEIGTGGFTTGVDYLVSRNFAVGLGGGYASSSADLVNGGDVDVDGGYIGSYVTFFTGGFYLDGAATVGWNEYETSRAGLFGFEHGDTEGREFNVLVGGGYDWRFGSFVFGPWATFQHSYVEIDSFSEDGDSVAPLHFPDQDQDANRSALGLKIASHHGAGNFIFRPELRVAWQHEFGDRDYDIAWSFRDFGDDHICSVFGPGTGKDSALIDAGMSVLFGRCRNFAASVFYNGNIARDDYERHAATGGFRVSF